MAKKARSQFYWSETRKQWRTRWTDDTGREHERWGASQTEATNKMNEVKENLKNGLVLDDNTTFEQFAKQWYEIKDASVSYSTSEMYANAINNHISPNIGKLRLKDVRPLHIQRVMAKLEGQSQSLQKKVLICANQIFDSAVENGLVLKNPCDKVKAAGEPAKEKMPLTAEQSFELFDAVKGTRAYLFVGLGLFTGLRREEIMGLKWDCIFLNAKIPYLSVKRAVHFEGQRGILDDKLKTASACRDIPIPEVLVSALIEAKQTTSSVMVVPSASGKHHERSSFRRMWEIAEKSVEFYITPHLLRHTYITRLCESGLDIKKIQYLAGHATVQMTLNIYSHVTQNRPEDLGSKVNQIFISGAEKGSDEKIIT